MFDKGYTLKDLTNVYDVLAEWAETDDSLFDGEYDKDNIVEDIRDFISKTLKGRIISREITEEINKYIK